MFASDKILSLQKLNLVFCSAKVFETYFIECITCELQVYSIKKTIHLRSRKQGLVLITHSSNTNDQTIYYFKTFKQNMFST